MEPIRRQEWTKLEAELAIWMQSFARPTLEFCAGYRRIPGFPSDGFRADGLLSNGEVLLALEVEVSQTHPDTNVGKYWLLSEFHAYARVILFHLYTPAFHSYAWRMKLGQFYARKMEAELPFEYVLLDRRHDGDPAATLAEVKVVLEKRIRREFAAELSSE